jgi:hypothetical protein
VQRLLKAFSNANYMRNVTENKRQINGNFECIHLSFFCFVKDIGNGQQYIKIDDWFQASASMLMRSTLFWDITQRRAVILYRRFGTKYRPRFQGSISLIGCPETSVKDYHSTLRNIPEERRPHYNKIHILYTIDSCEYILT